MVTFIVGSGLILVAWFMSGNNAHDQTVAAMEEAPERAAGEMLWGMGAVLALTVLAFLLVSALALAAKAGGA